MPIDARNYSALDSKVFRSALLPRVVGHFSDILELRRGESSDVSMLVDHRIREPRLPTPSPVLDSDRVDAGEQYLGCSQSDLPAPNRDSKTNKHEFLFLLPWGGNRLRHWGIQLITFSL